MSVREPPTAEATARLRILLVDDAEEVRRDLRTVLQFYDDLEVVGEAVNGIEAVSLADRLRPDMVLMDLRLPGIDGVEATEQICARALAKEVIMLTIYDEPENRARAARAGVDLFLVKGLSVEDLVAAIRQVSHVKAGRPNIDPPTEDERV
jgi:DNA-binding NarL/FixJ family response regulator